jgi:hypothetical protein
VLEASIMSSRITFLAASLALLGACTTPAPVVSDVAPGVVDVPPAVDDRQLAFTLASGTYHCDLGARVDVQRDPGNPHRIRIGWTGRHYLLERNRSHSGLPRYEDATSGLVWIDLPWKSVLLDGQRGKPLASECIALAPPA